MIGYKPFFLFYLLIKKIAYGGIDTAKHTSAWRDNVSIFQIYGQKQYEKNGLFATQCSR